MPVPHHSIFYRPGALPDAQPTVSKSGTAERLCAKFTGKTCLVRRSDEFECQDQRSRSPGTKTAFLGPFGGLHAVYVW